MSHVSKWPNKWVSIVPALFLLTFFQVLSKVTKIFLGVDSYIQVGPKLFRQWHNFIIQSLYITIMGFMPCGDVTEV